LVFFFHLIFSTKNREFRSLAALRNTIFCRPFRADPLRT
jgi:hypothetical protein